MFLCDLVVKVHFLSTFSNPFLSILRKWLVKGCNIILQRRMLHFLSSLLSRKNCSKNISLTNRHGLDQSRVYRIDYSTAQYAFIGFVSYTEQR